MKTKIYFYKNSAYNAVIFDQENGFYFFYEGQQGYIDGVVDLYAEDTADKLREYYNKLIADGQIDLSGICTSEFVIGGAFTADGAEESAELIAEYDDEDYAPYVEGLY